MTVPVGSSTHKDSVTVRRMRAVLLTERGWPAVEIARELGVSRRTVERHRSQHRHGRPIGRPQNG